MKKGTYRIRCDETVALKMGCCSCYFLGVVHARDKFLNITLFVKSMLLF